MNVKLLVAATAATMLVACSPDISPTTSSVPAAPVASSAPATPAPAAQPASEQPAAATDKPAAAPVAIEEKKDAPAVDAAKGESPKKTD